MTRDPLEELFGPLEPEEPRAETAGAQPTAPAGGQPTVQQNTVQQNTVQQNTAQQPGMAATPRPAVRRSAREELPTRPVPAEKRGLPAALPWIIVAAVAAIALIIAIVVVNQSRGTDSKPETTSAAPTPTQSADPEPSKSPSENDKSDDADDAEKNDETDTGTASDKAPKVEVGENPVKQDVTFANISVEVSRKLGPAYWYVPGGPTQTVMFHTSLMGTFPESCATMRSVEGKSPWGISANPDGKWTVIRPAGTCAADKELYNQVWGLMQAVADSAKPL